MPGPTMRHLEFCQNKFPCETASSVNTVAREATESVVAHEAGHRTEQGIVLSEEIWVHSTVSLLEMVHHKCDYYQDHIWTYILVR